MLGHLSAHTQANSMIGDMMADEWFLLLFLGGLTLEELEAEYKKADHSKVLNNLPRNFFLTIIVV